jgi:hypothetical protein
MVARAQCHRVAMEGPGGESWKRQGREHEVEWAIQRSLLGRGVSVGMDS